MSYTLGKMFLNWEARCFEAADGLQSGEAWDTHKISPRGVSNSFSAAGYICVLGFHAGQTLLKKKFKQGRRYISGPQAICLPAQETS